MCLHIKREKWWKSRQQLRCLSCLVVYLKLNTRPPSPSREFHFQCHTTSYNTAQPGPFFVSFIFPEVGSNPGGMHFPMIILSMCARVCGCMSQPSHHIQVRVCIHSAMSLPVNMRNIQEVKCSNGFVKRFPRGHFCCKQF